MRFRPCIDIHNGRVKQIIGSSLTDKGDCAKENFVSENGAAYYAELFRKDDLRGGHIILLNSKDSPYYEATREQALAALHAWPGGMQIGGGIRPETAPFYLSEGAESVIVTSYVFYDGKIALDRLEEMKKAVGSSRIVLDLSCRKKTDGDGRYYVMTDRWQKYTETAFDAELMKRLADSCCEFLVHAISVEGTGSGIDEELAELLAESPIPVTYAGGIRTAEDLDRLGTAGKGRVDFTIGSALDLYGGPMPYAAAAAFCR